MRRVIKSFFLMILFGMFIVSCKDDEPNDPGQGEGEKPVITDLAATPNTTVKYGDEITLTAKFEDQKGLKSYAYTITNTQGILYESEHMLTGKTFNLDVKQIIPLPKNAQTGDVTITLTLTNSSNVTETGTVTLTGVAAPDYESLYLVVGVQTYTMAKAETAGVYEVEGVFAAAAAGKIYTGEGKTGMYWGAAADKTITTLAAADIVVGRAEDANLLISFNTITFELTVADAATYEPTEEAMYIYGAISGHWQDGDISTELASTKMSGFASGDKRYWTWTPPALDKSDPNAGKGGYDMWGNINPGMFRFKKAGAEEYVLFDGTGIVTGTTNDAAKSFLISAGGAITFTLFYDGTAYNRLLLENKETGQSLEYTTTGIKVNGVSVPEVISFGGGQLPRKSGTYWIAEGEVELTAGQNITANGIDLSKAKADPDVFTGEGNATWKMIGSAGKWVIKIDPFTYDVYACKQTGYPDVIYFDSWGWAKNSSLSALNWAADGRLCLQRVGTTGFIYEATFWNFGYGDSDPNGPSMRFYFAPAFSDPESSKKVIHAKHFTDITADTTDPEGATLFMKRAPGGGALMKVRVDLKEGFTWDEEEVVADGKYYTITPQNNAKFTLTWTVL